MRSLAVAAGILLLTALTWFQFPGHTWLQQDTQIYAPVLEHLRDPAVLRRDMLVESPQVTFTLYDEVARGLRALSGLSFREVLEVEQWITRALGIWGLYLMATALGLSAPASLLVAGIISLGATIGGPAVLSVEIEPDPRGLAVPLLFLAVGLVAHGFELAAGIAGAAAFLLHPPTVYPFWAVYLCLAWRRRRFMAFLPLLCAGQVLWIAVSQQEGVTGGQAWFSHLSPMIEGLQRMRAPYSWISEWGRDWLPHYMILYAASLLALFRLRVPRELRFFLIGLPLAGMLSLPVSWVLLEKCKWALLPQFQPMRALLFVTAIAQFCAAAAGIFAVEMRRYLEALAWFALAYLVPVNANVAWMPSWNRALVVVLLAGAASLAAREFRWKALAMAGVTVAAYFLVPSLGGVPTYPHLHTPELAQLCQWAQSSTPRDSVFLFADAGKHLQPGIFRSEAKRAVYVDWKGGGQVNYQPHLALEWWSRWQDLLARPYDPNAAVDYRARGIDYIVLSPRHRLADFSPVFENSEYVAYVP